MSDQSAESDSKSSGHVLGDYRIVREIGRGGMGVVYEAEQLSLKRRVALKVLPFVASLESNRLTRFQIEAQAAACLKHRNIVPVYSIETDQDIHFYAMQYIDGRTLSELVQLMRLRSGLSVRLQEVAPRLGAEQPSALTIGEVTRTELEPSAGTTEVDSMSTGLEASRGSAATKGGSLWNEPSCRTRSYLRAVVALGVQTAEALNHAHESGIVHRDIKPSNLLLDEDGNVWVTDFGLALVKDNPGMTQPGEVLGTLRYMSPEQASGGPGQVDQRSDIYSLGATLYELLTLHQVAVGDNRTSLLRAISESDPRPLRSFNDAVPKDLETIVLKALSKETEKRYATARAFGEDLDRFLQDRPILATRPSLVDRAAKWARRHKTLAATGSLLVLMTLAALATWVRVSERQSSNAAGSLVARLMDAETKSIPSVIEEMAGYREWVNPVLEQIRLASETTDESRMRATLALLPVEPAKHAVFLQERTLQSEPEVAMLIGAALRRNLDDARFRNFVDSLAPILTDDKADPERRFSAALVLAVCAPDSLNVLAEQNTRFLADQLVATLARNSTQFDTLSDVFTPVSNLLQSRLTETYANHDESETRRLTATRLLVKYVTEIAFLAELIKDATPDQFPVLIDAIRKNPGRAIDLLREELTKTAAPLWSVAPVDASLPVIDSSLRTKLEQAHGVVESRFAFCQTLPMEEFSDVEAAMKLAGYRPASIRPFANGDRVQISAIWYRDNVSTIWKSGLTEYELESQDIQLRKANFQPEDLAAYVENGQVHYAALWARAAGPAVESRLVYGREDQAKFQNSRNTMREGGLAPHRQSACLTADGLQYYTGVWTADRDVPHSVGYSLHQAGYPGYEYVVSHFQRKRWRHTDVSVIAAPRRQSAREQLEQAERECSENPSRNLSRYARAKANFLLGNHQAAIEDLRSLDQDEPEHYRELARSCAQLGMRTEARSAAEKYEAIGVDYKAAALNAVVAAHFGSHVDGMSQLEATLLENSGDWQEEYFLYQAACAYSVASTVVSNQQISRMYADRAVELLTRTLDEYPHFPRYVSDEHDLDAIRDNPAYAEIADRLKLDRRYFGIWNSEIGFDSAESHGRNPEDHLIDCRRLAADGYHPRSMSLASVAGAGTTASLVSASVWFRPTPVIGDERLTRRKRNSAVALFHLGQQADVWPLLRTSHSENDLSLRNELIHRLPVLGASADAVVSQLDSETNDGAKQALILTLGEFYPSLSTLPPEREALVEKVTRLYADSSEAGIRSAARWLLRRWGKHPGLDESERSLPASRTKPQKNWSVNREGHTMVTLCPATFEMASPPSEVGHNANERLHSRTIDRRFSIAATEVTAQQYRRFLDDHPEFLVEDVDAWLQRDDAMAAGGVSWFAAAAYCNWLSGQEGIPQNQSCYIPNDESRFAEGMKLASDYLSRTGYRLPTEAEWEYSCRGGTSTPWSSGNSVELLGKYSWYQNNSHDRVHTIGELKPNLFGLFDMHGNVYEWCQEHFESDYPSNGETPVSDPADIRLWVDDSRRVLRGGSIRNTSPFVRSADRNGDRPRLLGNNIGFRVARTAPESPPQNKP